MRILAVSPYYEPDGGGLERYEHEILRRLAAGGHDVEACAYAPWTPPVGRRSSSSLVVTQSEERDGVLVHRLQPRGHVGSTPTHPGLGRWLEERLHADPPDVMLVHTPVPFPALTAARLAHRHGIPLVTTYHAGRLRGSNPILDVAAFVLRRTMEPRMLAASDRLIAVSPYVRDHALRRHRAKADIIAPGVDAHTFRPAKHVEPDFLFVGPLDNRYRWKGVDVLVDAFLALRRTHPEARLTLVGNGDRRAHFEELAAREGHIEVRPRLPDGDLVKALGRAAALVLPSTNDAEAFGMVLAEANACGRPVIGSAVGGIPDFVEDGVNGIVVPPGDRAALRGAMARILDDPDGASAMGRRGRRKVLELHDWDLIAEATERSLERAIESVVA